MPRLLQRRPKFGAGYYLVATQMQLGSRGQLRLAQAAIARDKPVAPLKGRSYRNDRRSAIRRPNVVDRFAIERVVAMHRLLQRRDKFVACYSFEGSAPLAGVAEPTSLTQRATYHITRQ